MKEKVLAESNDPVTRRQREILAENDEWNKLQQLLKDQFSEDENKANRPWITKK